MLQLVIASVMVTLTVLIHLAGLSGLVFVLDGPAGRLSKRSLFTQAVAILLAAFGLFALHTIEIWAYAGLYQYLGAVRTFEESLYFSTTTYATIGYGDVTLPKAWRILGAIEGANGIILLGWSTAFFLSIVGRIKRLEHDLEDKA